MLHARRTMLDVEPAGAAPDELKQLVEELKVCWAVYPEWGPDQRWQQQKVGFDLELVGTHFHPKHTPSPGCDECRKVYDALRRIADWILPKEERTSRYLIDAFEGKIAMTPRHGFRPDVTLTIRIVHRDEYRQPTDECENTCLVEMERNLTALGARRA